MVPGSIPGGRIWVWLQATLTMSCEPITLLSPACALLGANALPLSTVAHASLNTVEPLRSEIPHSWLHAQQRETGESAVLVAT